MWRCVVMAALLLVLLAATACEPGRPVEYQNTTSQRVTVYKEGRLQFTIEPHESKKIALFAKDWIPDVRVVAEDGRVLLEDHITWDEMLEMERKIVIADPDHP